MKHIRRTVATIAGMLVALVGFIAGAPAAFAVRLTPPGGGNGAVQPVANSSGMAYWQVSLIALGAAFFAAIVTALTLRIRLRTRPRAATA